jgi:THO complex subunit 2
MSLKESKKEALSQTREALMGEFGKFVGGFGRTKARLLRHKSDWFKPRKADQASDAMLEKCLIPRILLSPSDADFCFKMVKFLHDNGVPIFGSSLSTATSFELIVYGQSSLPVLSARPRTWVDFCV